MRKKRAEKRKVTPDMRYNDYILARFINNLMLSGKKNTARRIIYGAMDIIEAKTKENPIDVFKKAISNVAPVVEVRSRRVGGATYQVPVDVREDRRIALAIRWLKNYGKARRDKTMAQRLANEFMAAAKGEGSAVKKREDTHKMAEANKAFAHFKW
jgi:small subunit ribosomal protein S7